MALNHKGPGFSCNRALPYVCVIPMVFYRYTGVLLLDVCRRIAAITCLVAGGLSAASGEDGRGRTWYEHLAVLVEYEKYEKAIATVRSYMKDPAAFKNLSCIGHLHVGKVYQIVHKGDSAFLHFEEALYRAGASGDSALIVQAHTAWAEFHRFLADYHTAESMLPDFLHWVNRHARQYPRVAADYYNRFAAVISSKNCLDPRVMQYSRKAVGLAQMIGDSVILATSLNEIGFVYEHLGDQRAEEYYKRSLDIHRAMGRERSQITVLYNLARYHHHGRRYESGVKYASAGLDIGGEDKWIIDKAGLLELYAEGLHHLGRNDKAYPVIREHYTRLFRQLDQRYRSRLDELQAQYRSKEKELQLKEKTATILWQQKEIESRKIQLWVLTLFLLLLMLVMAGLYVLRRQAKSKNKKLNLLVRQNQFLQTESNHRIKNNLQLISSLIQREIAKPANQSHRLSLSGMGAKIEAVTAIHKQLYLHANYEEVDLHDYLRDILNHTEVLLTDYEVDLKQDIERVMLESNQAVYIGIMLVELIVNSIKHGFQKGNNKVISLLCRQEGHSLMIQYSDNGKGMLGEEEMPSFILMLIHQLRARYEKRSSGGFSVVFSIPLQQDHENINR